MLTGYRTRGGGGWNFVKWLSVWIVTASGYERKADKDLFARDGCELPFFKMWSVLQKEVYKYTAIYSRLKM